MSPTARQTRRRTRRDVTLSEHWHGHGHFQCSVTLTPPSSVVVNTQGRESGGSGFETCSGVWYPRRRPCGVAINTLVDLIKWLGKPQVWPAGHSGRESEAVSLAGCGAAASAAAGGGLCDSNVISSALLGSIVCSGSSFKLLLPVCRHLLSGAHQCELSLGPQRERRKRRILAVTGRGSAGALTEASLVAEPFRLRALGRLGVTRHTTVTAA